MKRYARNKAELAKRVGMSRQCLERYFELPDHPRPRSDSQLPVDAWVAFIAANRTQPSYGSNGFGSKYEPSPREKALTARASAEAARAEFRLSVERGEYLPLRDVCYRIEVAHSAVRRALNKALLHELLPTLEGLSASEMKRPVRRLIEKLSDDLVEQFNDYAVAGVECI
jgi:hypothetical protein